jgi:predicted short-subunit dehydrogenase-like oxidoreductase (DUF2520 family)
MSESRFIKIALVGAGSVATHLGLALKHAGFKIEYVLNRSSERGVLLAEKLDACYITGFNALNNPDLVILAVSDDAIPILAQQLQGCSFPVVHTSGTVSKEVLSVAGSDYGVFYPLQSFSPGREVDFSKVPICIDGSNSIFTNSLGILAHTLSCTVCQIDDHQRRVLHLAGVFACNFSNYLYTIADDILKKNDIPFELLLPLIQETAMKIQTTAPLAAQTGPAKRGDITTIQQHLSLIQSEPELLEIYKIFTVNLLKTYSHHASVSNLIPKNDK